MLPTVLPVCAASLHRRPNELQSAPPRAMSVSVSRTKGRDRPSRRYPGAAKLAIACDATRGPRRQPSGHNLPSGENGPKMGEGRRRLTESGSAVIRRPSGSQASPSWHHLECLASFLTWKSLAITPVGWPGASLGEAGFGYLGGSPCQVMEDLKLITRSGPTTDCRKSVDSERPFLAGQLPFHFHGR